MEESIVNLYQRFQKFKSIKPNEVSENIITKVDSLYQDLVFQNDMSDLKVSKETKEKIFRQTIQMYLNTPKSTGNMEIKFNDDLFWKTYFLTLDIDICELMLQGEKQILINLRCYNLLDIQVDAKRFKFYLQHKTDPLKIWFNNDEKSYVEKWFDQISQCVNYGKKMKRYEVKIEQMTRQINFEVLKNLDRNRNNENQNMFHSQELNSQKHYSMTYQNVDNVVETQSPQYIVKSLNHVIDPDSQQQVTQMSNSELLQNETLTSITKPKINIELPDLYEQIKEKLNYQYLTDDSDFILFSFDDNVRIMQNRNDCYNFRVYLPINESEISTLLQGLFDCNTQTKWNKQIKNIEKISQINPTQIQIKETRMQLGFLYQPRFFEYKRQFYCRKEEIYLIDKSIDQKGYANIDWHICGLFTKLKQPKLLIVDTRIINGGYITQQQDFYLTTIYLKEYAHFLQFSMELKLQKQLPDQIQDIIDIFESQNLEIKEVNHPQQIKQEQQIPPKEQSTKGQEQYFQQLQVKPQIQILEPPKVIKQNNYMYKSQPSLELQEQFTRSDSISYLKIKEKYLPKMQDIQEIPFQKGEDSGIIISERIGVSITVQEQQVNDKIPQNSIPQYQNQQMNQTTTSDSNKNSDQIKETQQITNESIVYEKLQEMKQEIKLDDVSGDEEDNPFAHQDIFDKNERSSMIMNSNQNYKELLEFVVNNKMYQSQLHQYNVNIKEWSDSEPRVEQIQGRHYFYRDEWQYDTKKGYMKYINAQKLEAQKKVLKYILSKIGANLLKGKSILNISLPVYVFEKRSNLQRFGASFALAPQFLENVPQQPEQQMAAVMAFSLSFTILYLNLEKPFNPILGETCQLWIKGCPVYLEQISHHPPVAAFIMYGRGYKIYGNLESTASIGPNTVTGGNEGKIIVEFPNAKIQYSYCKGYVTGITFGDRYFYTEGQQLYIDTKNEIIGELFFNPQKKGKLQYDYFEGKIYQVNQQIIQKYKKEGKIKMQNVQAKVLLDIEGNWQQAETMKVNGNVIFNIWKDFPFQCKAERNPLASDSQYREDLIGWQLDDFDLSMKYKEILEQKQRKDKKLRH